MTLQTSGPISLNQVNVELKLSGTAKISLNDAAVRKLLGKTSGAISIYDAYGKSDEIRFVNSSPHTSASVYELMGSPTAAGNYVFENKAEIKANTASYALRTGVFPAGSSLTIINEGFIYGLGGAGSGDVTVAGGAGGTAIYLDMSCQIDNTKGYISGGGGGGGSTQRTFSGSPAYFIRAGGGGGAGTSAGGAGVNALYILQNANTVRSNMTPTVGTATAGGAGGTISAGIPGNFIDTAYGGAGGTNGAAGAVGSTKTEGTSNSFKGIPTIGVAGAAGCAVIKNGKTLTQIAGFGTDRVIGAIV